jgi:hypothetical protein
MLKISGERRLVLKRAGRAQRLVPAGASEVVSEAEVVPMEAEEVTLAAVVADAAVNNPHCQIITWTLLLIR